MNVDLIQLFGYLNYKTTLYIHNKKWLGLMQSRPEEYGRC